MNFENNSNHFEEGPTSRAKKRFFKDANRSTKKRKLDNRTEWVKNLTSEEIELQRIEEEKRRVREDMERHQRMYNKINGGMPSFTPRSTGFQTPKKRQTEENIFRPTFKARKIPKTMNQPQLFIRSSDRPLTVPRDFNLSSPVNRHSLCFSPDRSLQDITPHGSAQKLSFESPGFKALPLPDFSSPFTPKKMFSPTKHQEFNLRTEIRGSAKKQNFEKQINEKNVAEQNMRHFRAKTWCHTTPTPIKSSDIPLVYPMDIELNSDRRAEQRSLFDENLREKERRQKEIQRQQEEERRIREEQEIAELRKSMSFKAQPISRNVIRQWRNDSNEKEVVKNWKDENANPNMSSLFCDESTIMETEDSGMVDQEMADAI
ncbi:unnamed protein product [Blepharisma stoltei]|uniref:TPX2 C-terminal domain-containing protein n=1 Tax=Blepharisma stoltei TaxID=1481888 RepID=A0AAU9JIH4_9CILI|nr:unnamed protein product [Blepharisma stoltei]